MKKLRLAVFNTQPPHLYFGGVERRIMETAKLLRNEVDMTVYCGTKAGFKMPTRLEGAAIIPCFSTDIAYPVDNWFFNRTLSAAADALKADVYEAHAVSGYGFLQALKKRKIRKPFIQTVHGVLADEYVKALQGGALTLRARLANHFMGQLARLEKTAAQNATLVVTVSMYSAEQITQYYNVDRAKIRIASNGVDIQKFRPMENREEIRRQIGVADRPCVLFVGRLIPRKGLSFLVEAAKQIVMEFKETVFLIVGNGPMRSQLLAYLKENSMLGNFRFLGDVNEQQLPALYNCADVFVLPSIQEGLGIVLLEAQATAIPVVAFDVGGVAEAMKAGETGLLIKPDSRELAGAILKLLSNARLRAKMGAKGRKFVSKYFSWQSCAQKMLQVYHEAFSS
ncbi:MAG: glycosyltransferase family 4 protein [Candidatus Bathyarchaeia archaeon]